MGTVGATRSILRGTIRFEREGLKLQWGVRFALGVGIPLFIGAATGDLIEAVAISGGALMVGLTDSGGPYRGRVRAMLITCVSVAVCTFVGELAGHNAIVLVALLAVASFGAGMFIALGLSTYFVALMAPLTITVVSSAPADAAHALERAALAFAGGLFAIALVLVPWRAHAHLPERRAIARVYRALATWVRDPNADDRRPILEAQTAARQALDASVGVDRGAEPVRRGVPRPRRRGRSHVPRPGVAPHRAAAPRARRPGCIGARRRRRPRRCGRGARRRRGRARIWALGS